MGEQEGVKKSQCGASELSFKSTRQKQPSMVNLMLNPEGVLLWSHYGLWEDTIRYNVPASICTGRRGKEIHWWGLDITEHL